MLNYRRLYYFWVVAQEGGFSRAAQRLDMAVQTVSAQVKALELDLGHQLLKPARRGLALTEAGAVAAAQAGEIFRIGASLPEAVAAAAVPHLRLAVGLSDGLSKLAAHRLIQPVLDTPGLRLHCLEGTTESLLAELGLHRLDLVLACRPPDSRSDRTLASRRLLQSPVDWYGPGSRVSDADIEAFPQCLNHLPLLLPTAHAALRGRIEGWFAAQRLRPTVVGEFADSALLGVFAAQGMGVFPVSAAGAADLAGVQGLRFVGRSDELHDEIHGIRSRRGLHHPLVSRILAASADG